MKLVLDASVVLKLVLVEDEQDQQIALDIIKNFQKGTVDVVLPSFWKYEVGNILVVKNIENYEDFYNFLLNLGLPIYDFNSTELIEVGRFALEHKVSFYDASYHFLAKSTDSTFITADERYFEKVKRIGNIVLLKNLNLPL